MRSTTMIEDALAALRRGEVIVVPTDTVYGLAASLEVVGALDGLFELKDRERAKAVPVLGAGVEDLSRVASLDRRARFFAARFWPGPLTLVLPRAGGFAVDLGGEEPGTVAVRVPRSELARELLAASGPLAVTSANLSGEPPATTVAQARAIFGPRVGTFLDEGPSDGTPSTVLSLVGAPIILREGAVGEDELWRALDQRS